MKGKACLLSGMKGVVEASSVGVLRLHAMLKAGALKTPALRIDDAIVKVRALMEKEVVKKRARFFVFFSFFIYLLEYFLLKSCFLFFVC